MRNPSINFLTHNACHSDFNIVALPLRADLYKKRSEDPVVDQYIQLKGKDAKVRGSLAARKWDFDPTFMLYQLQGLIGDTPYLSFQESEEKSKLYLMVSEPRNKYEQQFMLVATLDSDKGEVTVEHLRPGKSKRSALDQEITIASLINIFSACGFSDISFNAHGVQIPLLANMGFTIPEKERESLWYKINSVGRLMPDSTLAHETETKSYHDIEDAFGDWESNLRLWDRYVDGQRRAREISDILDEEICGMRFNCADHAQFQQLLRIKSTFHETRPSSILSKTDVRNTLSIVP